MVMTDPFDLERFTMAQEAVYERVRAELSAGRKRTHWMWYVFPQVTGLGRSSTSALYAIRSEEEARAYLEHPILGARLRECTNLVLAVEGKSALDILGSPDDVKFQSSMTLFASIVEPESIFSQALDRYFGGERDVRTVEFLKGSA